MQSSQEKVYFEIGRRSKCSLHQMKINSSPLKAMMVGRLSPASFWVLVTFQGRAVKLRGGGGNVIFRHADDDNCILGDDFAPQIYRRSVQKSLMRCTSEVVQFHLQLEC